MPLPAPGRGVAKRRRGAACPRFSPLRRCGASSPHLTAGRAKKKRAAEGVGPYGEGESLRVTAGRRGVGPYISDGESVRLDEG